MRPTVRTICPLPPGTAGAAGAVAAGADLVVQSAHKTLPSLTQTAFLQLNGDLADPAEVERQLDVFETSSLELPAHGQSGRLHPLAGRRGRGRFAAWRTRWMPLTRRCGI